jgi:enamine deaminase RidA (YjgF/YER057c/UK114 family)
MMKLIYLTLPPIIGLVLGLSAKAAEKKVIIPVELAPRQGAPAPLFSPGILVDGTLYVSGQMGTDLKTRQIPDNFDDEVKNTLNTIGLILKEAGMGYQDVVSVTVYLSDIELFPKMNAIYGHHTLKCASTTSSVSSPIGPAATRRPLSRMQNSLATRRANGSFCSTSSTVSPSSLFSLRMMSPISWTILG